MANIAQHLPKESPTVTAIYAAYKRAGDSEPRRGYLGASIIGHSCARYLWYTFRACCRPEFTGRMYRLLERGDLEEVRFCKDLRDIGCTVHEIDPDTGKQFEVSALGGHFSGHMDGCAVGIPEAPKTWHVCEFKTHNAKSYAKLQKEGVEKAKPQHFAQMQVYMHLTGMTRAIYMAVNKDTDEIYVERVRYDKQKAEALLTRAERIIASTTPPERIASRPDYYECSWCDAKTICWASSESSLPIASISCRQCCHATPTMDGHARWMCEKHRRGLSEGDQARACDDHLVLPGLISFAEPVDYGRTEDGYDFIVFRDDVWDEWRHGRGAGAFSTKELMAIPPSQIGRGMVTAVKETFGATIIDYTPDDILHRYPEADARIVWTGKPSHLIDAWKSQYGEDLAALTPIAKCDGFDFQAAEFSGSRVAILWHKQGVMPSAEIREGVE